MEGWIKLHRQIINHWIFQDADYLQAWLYILLLASHMPKEVLVKKHLYKLNPGELCWSQNSLAKHLRWSRGKLVRFLKLLEKEKMITQKTDSRTSIITVCKWTRYQQERTADETAYGHQTDIRRDTNNNGNNGNKREKRTHFLPPTVEELTNYFQKIGLNGNSKIEASKFYDYYQSVGWKIAGRSQMRNWKAAARNWKRRDSDFSPKQKEEIKIKNPPFIKISK